jgi:quercetin dioxygenase-like cupin family protein
VKKLLPTLKIIAAMGTGIAAEAHGVVVAPVISTDHTWTGQPITLPQNHPWITVSTYDIPAGALLPEHKHPYPRYGYVIAGTLQVTSTTMSKTAEFKAGDFIAESVGQWHHAVNPGTEETRLLVIDVTPDDPKNTIFEH